MAQPVVNTNLGKWVHSNSGGELQYHKNSKLKALNWKTYGLSFKALLLPSSKQNKVNLDLELSLINPARTGSRLKHNKLKQSLLVPLDKTILLATHSLESKSKEFDFINILNKIPILGIFFENRRTDYNELKVHFIFRVSKQSLSTKFHLTD